MWRLATQTSQLCSGETTYVGQERRDDLLQVLEQV